MSGSFLFRMEGEYGKQEFLNDGPELKSPQNLLPDAKGFYHHLVIFAIPPAWWKASGQSGKTRNSATYQANRIFASIKPHHCNCAHEHISHILASRKSDTCRLHA